MTIDRETKRWFEVSTYAGEPEIFDNYREASKKYNEFKDGYDIALLEEITEEVITIRKTVIRRQA